MPKEKDLMLISFEGTSLARPVIARAQIEVAKVGSRAYLLY
jgi:argininosuccinate synthase